MLRCALRRTIAGAVLTVSTVIVLTSCAAFQRGPKTAPASPPPASAPVAGAVPASVYYAAVGGLKVYSEPSGRSKVLGMLALHEKVARTRLVRGYAYVESAERDLKGWVINAQLIWRLPSAPGAAEGQPEEQAAPAGDEAPAAVEAAPEAGEPPAVEPPAAEAAPVPAAPPQARPTPGGVAPSIFNPY